jgi:hypothetical protein
MKLLHLLLLIGVSSCASTLTEEEQYEKDDRETLRLERFHRAVADCDAMRGHMVVEGSGSKPASVDGKIQSPGPGQTYYCSVR